MEKAGDAVRKAAQSEKIIKDFVLKFEQMENSLDKISSSSAMKGRFERDEESILADVLEENKSVENDD